MTGSANPIAAHDIVAVLTKRRLRPSGHTSRLIWWVSLRSTHPANFVLRRRRICPADRKYLCFQREAAPASRQFAPSGQPL